MKGFLPSDGNELFVLRKSYGTIHKRHPAQIMYDKDLYTIMFQSERSQMIEDFYSEVENRLPGAFKIMDFLVENPEEYIEAEKNIEFNLLIKSIIALQFWRTPSQNKLARKYADQILMLYDSSSDQTKKAM